jgi:CheY-like chemotaxis protein
MHTGIVRLLTVDDDAAFTRLIRLAFETRSGSYKWELAEAADGETAIAHVFGSGIGRRQPSPDIILLDWNLPRMSGDDVLVRFKEHPELRKVPILILSSSDSGEDINLAYSHYANGYLTKPASYEALESMVNGIEMFWINHAQLASPQFLAAAASR